MDEPAVVLDASALLAPLNGEHGANRVEAALPRAVISAVNLEEVVGKLSEIGMPESEIRLSVDALALRVIPFDANNAYRSGLLRQATRAYGLSLGDHACLELAITQDRTALTTDRQWLEIQLPVAVESLR